MKHLLPGRYLMLQGRTYDLAEGHMVHFDDLILFPQHMEAVFISTIQTDDHGEEKMISNLSVDNINIPSASYESFSSYSRTTICESLWLQVKLYEDFYKLLKLSFNISASLVIKVILQQQLLVMKVLFFYNFMENILQVLKLLLFKVLFEARYRNLFNVISLSGGQVNPHFSKC